jgi:SAM-dependent methyltransferase
MQLSSDERQQARQRAHFDANADAYAEEAAAMDVHSESLFRCFVAFANPPPQGRMLEMGAGGGRYTIPLLRLGYAVDAVDLSPVALDRLTDRARAEGLDGRLRTFVGDAAQLSLEPVYDLVYGIHLLHHVPDPVRVLTAMRCAARPGGAVACVEPNPINPAWYPYITFNPLRSWAVEYRMLREFPWQLSRTYRRAGFAHIERRFYGIVPIPLVNWFPALLGAEARLNRLPALRFTGAVQIMRGSDS